MLMLLIEKVKRMKAKKYKLKDAAYDTFGVVAQEVGEVFPEAVSAIKMKDDDEEGTLITLWINAIGINISKYRSNPSTCRQSRDT